MNLVAPSSTAPTIKVMVVDDSAVVRGLLSRQLAIDPDIDVVCTASNGEIALAELKRRLIDLVILDIDMPVMDGMTALARIVVEHPKVRVIMASTATQRNAEISLRALRIGACDYIAKPESGLSSAEDFNRDLTAKVKALGRPSPSARISPPSPTSPQAAAPPVHTAVQSAWRPKLPPTVLAIGASTGGPPALLKLFIALRGAVDQPIFVTQHMPATFTALLAEQLSRSGERACAEGCDGEPVKAGRCYIAPGGWHMVVEKNGSLPVVRLNKEPPENFCRPAVDPMLRSIARVYGAGAMAIILTGMGSDGAKGCEAIAASGGRFIAQDEPTSVVWGMPGAAVATGLSETVLPLEEIGPWTRRATGSSL